MVLADVMEPGPLPEFLRGTLVVGERFLGDLL